MSWGHWEFYVNHDPSIYSRLILDPSISNGAFRLWHYLRDRAGHKGVCWPGQRLIKKELGCSYREFHRWLEELKNAQYLRVKPGNERFSTRYHLPVKSHSGGECEMTGGVSAKSHSGVPVKSHSEPTSSNLPNERGGPDAKSGSVPGAERVQLCQELKQNEEKIKSLWSESMSPEDIQERKRLRARNAKIKERIYIPL